MVATTLKSDIFGKGMVPKLDIVTIGFRKEIKKQDVIKNSAVKRNDIKSLRFEMGVT